MCLKFLTDIKMDHLREVLSDDDNIPLGKPFEWKFTLEVGEDAGLEATQLQFKGITYADNIDDLTISEIVMEYKNAAGGEQQQ